VRKKQDYEVGYGKPPKASRWRKGQSGNSRGRRRGVRNLKTELTEELSQVINVRESGVAKKITKQRAFIKALTAKAVQGDTRAANILLNLIFRMLRPDLIESAQVELSDEDRAILESFVVLRRPPNEESGS
jgi:hypothetical protein